MEKPLGVTARDGLDISEAIADTGTPAMIGLTGRFHPEFQTAYKAMADGEIGPIVSMNERIHSGPAHRKDIFCQNQSQGRGIGLENGIHTFDRIQWFTNSHITRIDGVYKSNQHLLLPVDDYVTGVAVNDSGQRIPFSLRWTDHQEYDYVFQISGAAGLITVEGFSRCTLTKRTKKKILYEHNLADSLRERHKPGFAAELKHFAAYLRGETSVNFVNEALAAQKAVELLYE